MKPSSVSPLPAAAMPDLLVLLLLLAAPLRASAMLRCDHIQADGQKFDLSKLKGPHSVVTIEKTPDITWNSTYTLDLCGPLKRKGDVKKGDECPNGTWGMFSASPLLGGIDPYANKRWEPGGG